MKNVLKLFFLLFIAFFLVSCNGDDKPEKTITTLTLSTTKLELVEGETGQIEAVAKTDKDEAVAITYEVSDPTIASVNSSGKVTAIQEGSTTVTLTANDKTAT